MWLAAWSARQASSLEPFGGTAQGGRGWLMGCGCFVVLLASAFPRLALAVTWIFTDRVDIAFDGWVLPLAGLIFLPYTTFFYVLAFAPIAGVTGFGWFLVVLGFLLDVSSYAGSGRIGAQRYSPA